jgi:CRP-like cAMP-binding protein
MTQLANILRQEIHGISEDALERFMQLWKIEKQISRHQLLYPRNSINTNIYFILKGSLKICYDDGEKEMITGFGFASRFIFDIYSFFSEKPSRCYIKAIKSSTLIGISKKDFLAFVGENSFMTDFWEKQKDQIILRFAERDIENLTYSPKERYQLFKKRNPDFLQQIPNKDIATYLRMAPETLSRMKKS